MNKSDSERVGAVLDRLGYVPTSQENEAELIVVNSCAVRQSAMDRIYGKSGQWQHLRKKGKLKTVLTGCVLELDKVKLRDQFDICIDIRDIAKLPQLLGHDLEMKVEDYFDIKPAYNSKFQAFVPIMTGCDKFCTYCAVPYTRGREVSRPVSEILNEVRALITRGCKEITLLGQNVNSYQGFYLKKELDVAKDKRDISQSIMAGLLSKRKVVNAIRSGLPMISSATTTTTTAVTEAPVQEQKRATFPELLQLICDIPGKFWIRFLTSHPYDMSDDLIETVAQNEKLCKYIHLPVQAGDDVVLKKMNRHYTVDHYVRLMNKVRERMPEVAISTDIIVGFCGETAEQFEGTARLFEDLKYDMAYIAQYSPREGTVAENSFADDVSKEDKILRDRRLNEILSRTALQHHQKYLGREIDVLVDSVEPGPDGLLVNYGKSETFKTTKFVSARSFVGEFVKVRIKSVAPFGLEGELV